MAKKQFRIQSVQHLIELKRKRLNFTRIPYLREYLLQDIADLEQVDWLFYDLKKEIQELKNDCGNLTAENNKLECAMRIYGLSDDEIFALSIMDSNELKRLYLLAIYLGEYKIPQRFLTKNNNLTNESEIQ